MISEAENQVTPLQESLAGEIRQGDRFAYWLETVQTRNSDGYAGQISIFLIEDINKLQVELQNR
jgi:hypothetical protein